MRKIIIFSTASKLYGSERSLLNLSRALGEKFDVWVILNRKGILQKRLEQENVKVKVFPLSYLTFSFAPFLWMRNTILFFIDVVYFMYFVNTKKIDLICINNSMILFPLFVSVLSRRPAVSFFRENYNCKFLQKSLSRFFLYFSYKLIFPSQDLRNISCPECKNTEVVYDCFFPSDFGYLPLARKELGISENKIVVSYISRLHPSKGQQEFIKTIRKALNLIEKDVVFLIGGDISPQSLRLRLYHRRLRHLIRNYNLQDKVILAGFKDINKLLSVSQIVVYCPQKEEPFGLNVLEALCWQKKVVLDLRGGLKEIVKYFDPSLYLYPLSVKNLTEAVNHAGFDPGDFSIPDRFSFLNYKRSVHYIFSQI